MGFLTPKKAPILEELPLLPTGYRWAFGAEGTPWVEAGPKVVVLIQKRRKWLGWKTVARRTCEPAIRHIRSTAIDMEWDLFEYSRADKHH